MRVVEDADEPGGGLAADLVAADVERVVDFLLVVAAFDAEGVTRALARALINGQAGDFVVPDFKNARAFAAQVEESRVGVQMDACRAEVGAVAAACGHAKVRIEPDHVVGDAHAGHGELAVVDRDAVEPVAIDLVVFDDDVVAVVHV